MNRKNDRVESLKDALSPYMGTVKFFLGIAVTLLSLFLYLYQPAQGTILARAVDEQSQQLEVTREGIAKLSIQLSDQITLDRVQQYARTKGLQFGDNSKVYFMGEATGGNQTAMRR